MNKSFSELYAESSLSRIQSKTAERSTGAITAFRGGFTKRQNMQRNKKLLSQLLKSGFSVTTVKGSYIEDYGTEDATEVGETSFFVSSPTLGDDNGKLERHLIKLGKQYEQDSILSVRFGQDANLIGTNDSEFPGLGNRVPVGKATFGKAGEFFSRVNGRSFQFETYKEKSRNARMAITEITKMNIDDIDV